MNKVVGFTVGCMGLLVLALVGVAYFGMSGSWTTDNLEGQTVFQVEQWAAKKLNDKDRKLLKLGPECVFDGEKNRYRIAEFQTTGSSSTAAPERYVLLSKENGVVIYHWPLAAFIEERKKEATAESTPERKAWREQRLETLLKKMEAAGDEKSGPERAPGA